MPLRPEHGRLGMRLLGAAAAGVGAGTLALPRTGARLLGLEADGRGLLFYARLFGCRDVAIGLGLLREAARPRPDPAWMDMVALSQAGDVALAVIQARRGSLSRRSVAVLLLTAGPSAAAAVLIRAALGRTDGA